jgi:hypothetical protein
MRMFTAVLLSASASIASFASPARADIDWSVGFSVGSGLCEPTRRVWVEPIYRTECVQVWVEPVYQTVCDRVWVEAVYEDRCERVWVEPVYTTREVRYRDHCGRVRVRTETVCVREGYWTEQRGRVLVREGYWSEQPRQVLVSNGYYRTEERQVIVREGYWAEVPLERSEIRIEIGDRHNVDRGDDHGDRYDRDRDGGRLSDDDRHDRSDRRDPRADRDRERGSRESGRDESRRSERSSRGDRGERYR